MLLVPGKCRLKAIGESGYHGVGANGTLALANQTTAIKSYLPSLDYKIHRCVFGRVSSEGDGALP
jgi:hypothetical protein